MKRLDAALTAALLAATSTAVFGYDTGQVQQLTTDGTNLITGATSDQVNLGTTGAGQAVSLVTGATTNEKNDAQKLAQDGAGLVQGSGSATGAIQDAKTLAGDATQAQLTQSQDLLNTGQQLLNSVTPEQKQQFASILNQGQQLINNPNSQAQAQNLIQQGESLAKKALNQANTGH